VICSLWAVNDVASILVWDHFYECLREGELPHIALSRAQHHLREITVGRIQEFASRDDLMTASRARFLCDDREPSRGAPALQTSALLGAFRDIHRVAHLSFSPECIWNNNPRIEAKARRQKSTIERNRCHAIN
jgi:CHAT domain-containing protein